MAELSSDSPVERMKEARGSSSVSKLELIQLKTRCPGTKILVVEGVDDKITYSQWIRRIRENLKHEYYVCKGKRGVLQLREAAVRDLNNLSDGVFYFVDRDFDDLAGYPESEDIFMTDRYSVENYLVSKDVLEEILKIELHCNGEPEIREVVLSLFEKVYDEFLNKTRELNKRLFLAQRANIKRVGAAPDKISQIAIVHLDKVEEHVSPAEDIIQLEREPTDAEVEAHSPEFDALAPRDRYRGKFAFKFFTRWLDAISDDYSSANSVLFAALDRSARAKRHEVVSGTLASRSQFPNGLEAFVAAI